jgi:ribonuclease I
MNKSLILLLACIGIVASSSNYEYYVFAVEWAGTVCNFENCNATGLATNWFNIHGLWPSDLSNSSAPAYCTGISWDASDISSTTQSELNTYWSGLYSSNNEFHDHEWTKNGTCWNDNVNGANPIEDFFSTVLTVAQQVGVYHTLETAGITPSSTQYKTATVLEALSSVYGKVNLQCEDGDLQTIEICLDLNYAPMDCPDLSNNCGYSLRFPTFSGISGVENQTGQTVDWTLTDSSSPTLTTSKTTSSTTDKFLASSI